MRRVTLIIAAHIIFLSCNDSSRDLPHDSAHGRAQDSTSVNADSIPKPAEVIIAAQQLTREDLVAFAKTLIGVSYHEAGTDPVTGFDCSGFITYIFKHFAVIVPRSSVDFTNLGTEVSLRKATAGDLILFTGTDSSSRIVGHMGIVTENTDSLRFIHATSGKKYGVTITALNEYYMKRFVKVIDISARQGSSY